MANEIFKTLCPCPWWRWLGPNDVNRMRDTYVKEFHEKISQKILFLFDFFNCGNLLFLITLILFKCQYFWSTYQMYQYIPNVKVSICFKYHKYQYFTSIKRINTFQISKVSIPKIKNVNMLRVSKVSILLKYQSINTLPVSKVSILFMFQCFSSTNQYLSSINNFRVSKVSIFFMYQWFQSISII